MTICPRCNGAKRIFVFADGHDADGNFVSTSGERDCLTCKGVGEITDDHANRIKIGKSLRDDRVAKGFGLREAALLRGCTPAELSAIEQGN